MKKFLGTMYAKLMCLLAVLFGVGTVAQAQTDISEVTTTVGNYKDAAIAVAVGVLLFVVGRAVIRKLIK